MTAIEKAIAQVGRHAIAKATGQFPQAVDRWRRQGRVPANHCLAVETATDGRVTRYELRPDIYGADPAKAERRRKAA